MSEQREITEGEAVGIAAAVQAQLVGVHNTFGEDLVINGIAQYALIGGEDHAREHWSSFVGKLRDVYFEIAKLQDNT
jgi:hypothetical protein